MGSIIELPREIYNKIAAGEVIDGPYSVVRELIDNSVDADSKNIKIVTQNGGKGLIIVEDDGEGMSWEDAVLSVKRHTTSKIKKADDLYKITTLGFRGEALCSISSVSDFELITKREEDNFGVKVIYKFGKHVKTEPAPSNRGTKITVKSLFENLPARRKFLKSNRAENNRTKSVVLNKALSFPEIGFFYRSDDRVIFNLRSDEDLFSRIVSIFGDEIKSHLINVEYSGGNFLIKGYITDRDFTMMNRREQHIFVNKRPVYNRAIQYAINEASRRLITQGRYIYTFLNIYLDPELVDVNVHPAKLEVKIKIENEVVSAIYHKVYEALQRKLYNFKGESDKISFVFDSNGRPYYHESQNYRNIDSDRGGNLDIENGSNVYSSSKNLEQGFQQNLQNRQSMNLAFTDSKIELFELNKGEINVIKNVDINDFDFCGTIFRTYLIFTVGEIVLYIDQHAAHERILYEEYLKAYHDKIAIKNLLIPITLNPPPEMYDDLLENSKNLKNIGIVIEPFGEDSINIISVPGFVPDSKEERLVSEFFTEYFEKKNITEDVSSFKDRFLKFMACRTAIKEGNKLSEQEAYYLLKKLFECDVPYQCPHGRPTILKQLKLTIDRRFKRR